MCSLLRNLLYLFFQSPCSMEHLKLRKYKNDGVATDGPTQVSMNGPMAIH